MIGLGLSVVVTALRRVADAVTTAILLESGDRLLLESGDVLLLES